MKKALIQELKAAGFGEDTLDCLQRLESVLKGLKIERQAYAVSVECEGFSFVSFYKQRSGLKVKLKSFDVEHSTISDATLNQIILYRGAGYYLIFTDLENDQARAVEACLAHFADLKKAKERKHRLAALTERFEENRRRSPSLT